MRNKIGENNDSLFDVAQGSYLGAELRELLGLFVLSGLKYIFEAGNVGLYLDGGMAILLNCFGFKVERLKKQTHAYFKSLGLRITVLSPLMITDFLDVELNLNDISYMLYRKQNSNIIYINKSSSHSYIKNIIKQIPNINNDRLNKRSSAEENFLKVKSDYELIMEKFGNKEKLPCKNSEQSTQNTSKKEI